MRLSILVSLVVHFSVLLVIGILPRLDSKKSQPKDLLEFELVTESPAVKTERVSSDKRKLSEQKTQIVDQMDKALNQETPEEVRFFSQNNQVVKKQTRSANRGEFKNASSWKSFQPQSQFLKEQNLKPSEEGEKQVTDSPKKSDAKEPVLDPQDQNEGIASATLDYIQDIDVGLETLLSTKEFKYYTYFRRIRNQLNQHWTPKIRKSVSKVYRKGRRIASDQDLVTRTVVVLNPEGYLLKVLVIGDSGFRELDQAALEALKEAAPFKNPPKGMRDPDGLVRIRWDFVIEG